MTEPDTLRALVLYASAGMGHQRAAEAVVEALGELPGVEARLVDALQYCRPRFRANYPGMYLWLATQAPWLWAVGYYLTDWRLLRGATRWLRRANNRWQARDLEAFIDSWKPQVVVVTHFLPEEVVAHLKRQSRTSAALVVVVTDFGPHEFWMAPAVDGYAVGSQDTAKALIARGAPGERVAVTGIPVARRFSRTLETRPLRAALGIPAAAFAVLVASGGFGCGPIEAVAHGLLQEIPDGHAVVVCGHNVRLQRRLERLLAGAPGRLHVLGFVENMHEWMAACDVVVTKPGGLTLCESMAMGKAPVLFSPIPGQESRNVRIVTAYGAARCARNASAVVRIVAEWRGHPEAMAAANRAAADLGAPEASVRIAEVAVGAARAAHA